MLQSVSCGQIPVADYSAHNKYQPDVGRRHYRFAYKESHEKERQKWREVAELIDERGVVGGAQCYAEAYKRQSHLEYAYVASGKEAVGCYFI